MSSGTIIRRDDLLFNLDHKIVFLGVFLQLVADGAHNILDFSFKKLLERVYRNGWLLSVELLNLLLVVKNGHNLGVVVSVLLCALAIVKIDQHVRQVLVQSGLYIVSTLLGRGALLLLMPLCARVLLRLLLIRLLVMLLLLLISLSRLGLVGSALVVLACVGGALVSSVVLLSAILGLLIVSVGAWLSRLVGVGSPLGSARLSVLRSGILSLRLSRPLVLLIFNFI